MLRKGDREIERERERERLIDKAIHVLCELL